MMRRPKYYCRVCHATFTNRRDGWSHIVENRFSHEFATVRVEHAAIRRIPKRRLNEFEG